MLQVEQVAGEVSGKTTVLVRARGEVDFASAPLLLQVLTGFADACRIIVTFENCRYLDSSGLRALENARNLLGERLHIVVPKHGMVRRVFAVTGLFERLHVHESLAAITPAHLDSITA